ncbi:MAG: hypothetical protein PHV99_00290 [Candidatus Pacebacteria bacterium]|nr:hypothetical protein [Candidatus Paceibacterota bacterium]
MIDLVEFKQLLSPEVRALPEKEIERIRELQYGFANAIFEMWLRDRHTSSIEENENNTKS